MTTSCGGLLLVSHFARLMTHSLLTVGCSGGRSLVRNSVRDKKPRWVLDEHALRSLAGIGGMAGELDDDSLIAVAVSLGGESRDDTHARRRRDTRRLKAHSGVECYLSLIHSSKILKKETHSVQGVASDLVSVLSAVHECLSDIE